MARRLFDTYDRDRNGQIDNVEVVPMIVDVYKSFNRIFSPSRGDIDSFYKYFRNSKLQECSTETWMERLHTRTWKTSV